MRRPKIDYTLIVTKPDGDGKICITSPEEPGLIIYAKPKLAFEDVPTAIEQLRKLNLPGLKAPLLKAQRT